MAFARRDFFDEAKAVVLSRTDEATNKSLILRSFSVFTITLNVGRNAFAN
jgi:hypothetical protein